MPITATFNSITFGQRGVQPRNVFVATQEAGQQTLSTNWQPNLNLFRAEANALEANVNAKEASVNLKATEAAGSATAASVSATYAEQMRNETAGLIELLLLPADVSLTYSKAAIDTMMNKRDLENFINFKL